jgi:hypothetical protein
MASRPRPCARCIIGGVVGSLVVAWSLLLLVRLVRTVARGAGRG